MTSAAKYIAGERKLPGLIGCKADYRRFPRFQARSDLEIRKTESVPDIFRTVGNVSGDLAATVIAGKGQPADPPDLASSSEAPLA